MIEVEIKIKIKDLATVKYELHCLGFFECSNIIEEDFYFDNAEGRIRNNGQALRIRTVTDVNTNKKESLITFKGEKLDDISMTRQELETTVLDGEACCLIFKKLGYDPVKPCVRKHRLELKKESMTACLDEVEGLGSFLELENVISESDSYEEALKEIELILNQLGYSFEDTTRTSYLSQLQGVKD